MLLIKRTAASGDPFTFQPSFKLYLLLGTGPGTPGVVCVPGTLGVVLGEVVFGVTVLGVFKLFGLFKVGVLELGVLGVYGISGLAGGLGLLGVFGVPSPGVIIPPRVLLGVPGDTVPGVPGVMLPGVPGADPAGAPGVWQTAVPNIPINEIAVIIILLFIIPNFFVS